MTLRIIFTAFVLFIQSNSGIKTIEFYILPNFLTTMLFKDAITIVDPWLTIEREKICFELLNSTRIPALFGEDNLGNILWGLIIQTQWQITSGRQQSKHSDRIDEFQWFAGINYQLIIVPYLAAINSKLLSPAKLLSPQLNSPIKFPTTFETIDSEIAHDWTSYFEAIKILQVNSTYISLEDLQKLLWSVHSKTLAKALPKFENELQLANLKERKFANGFGHFVEILATMNLNTSYHVTYPLNKFFPQRILKPSDTPPFIYDMTVEQNAVVSTFFSIDDMTKIPFVWSHFVETFRKIFSFSKL